MLYDEKKGKGGGLPPAGLGGRVTHFRYVPDKLRRLGTGLVPLGGEDRQSLKWNQAWRACLGGLSGGYEVHLTGTRPARGSSGCLVAIDGRFHQVLTLGFWGGRSGGDSRSRSSRTLLEGGSGVITPVAAMGGRGRTTGWDSLIVPAPGAGWILTFVSRPSMVKHTNRARRVGGGASLMGVSISPTVSKPGGSAC